MSEIHRERQLGRPKAPAKPKKEPRPGDSEAYLALIRQCPCAVDRVLYSHNIQPHHQNHLAERGLQEHVEDCYCIPLHPRRHHQLHSIGSTLHGDVLLGWGIDGQALADELWRIYQDEDEPLEAMRAAVMNHEVSK